MAETDKHSLLRTLGQDRAAWTMLGLGFSSGLPFLLVYQTQSTWLWDAKVPVAILGYMSWLTVAYKLKFVWAPFLERNDAPLLGRLLGRRRGWIVAAQIGVALSLLGIAFGDPGRALAWTIAFSLALGFAGATQDLSIDGWRITSWPVEQQPIISSIAEMGWRVGTLVAGSVALILSDFIGWRGAYFCMAAALVPGFVAALAAREPEPAAIPEAETHAGPVRTILVPIQELWTRLGHLALPILLMIALFRMPGYVAAAMANPLFKSLHISNSDIGTVTKLMGFWIGLAGNFLASFVVPRFGLMPSLLLGTVAGSASHLSLAWLAAHGGNDFAAFATAVSVDAFAYSFASIVLITYMSSITSRAHAASQYGLLTSLCALPGFLLAGQSGWLVGSVGFERFFVITSLIGIPGAWLCWRVGRAHPPLKPAAATSQV